MHFLVYVNKNNDLTADWREPFENRRSSSGRDRSSYIDHRTTNLKASEMRKRFKQCAVLWKRHLVKVKYSSVTKDFITQSCAEK